MNDRRVFVHDMKNHLAVILGYANMLIEELPETDPHREDANQIYKAGEHAMALLAKLPSAENDPT